MAVLALTGPRPNWIFSTVLTPPRKNALPLLTPAVLRRARTTPSVTLVELNTPPVTCICPPRAPVPDMNPTEIGPLTLTRPPSTDIEPQELFVPRPTLPLTVAVARDDKPERKRRGGVAAARQIDTRGRERAAVNADQSFAELFV